MGIVIIEDDCEIGCGSTIERGSMSNTIIGKNNKIYPFASIGNDPQDLKFNNENTTCTIGDNNTIREYSSIHRGTKDGISDTIIGNNNLLMAYTHIAHDCVLEDNCILSNAASLAGHVRLESNVSLGGFTLVHQFCHIGKFAFSGLGTVVSQDVTPYTLIAGNHAKAYKINSEGLRRKKFDSVTINDNSLTDPVPYESIITDYVGFDVENQILLESLFADFLAALKHITNEKLLFINGCHLYVFDMLA